MAVATGRFARSKNPNWKGGRSITSHGYVLVRVGIGHPLADCRGYAYEHRLIAEKIIGRPLKAGELVHHKNGNKKDNSEGNIEVVQSIAAHLHKHRSRESNRRDPGQRNRNVKCKCGCGETFQKFDSYGRPRSYVSGHNMKVRHGG